MLLVADGSIHLWKKFSRCKIIIDYKVAIFRSTPVFILNRFINIVTGLLLLRFVYLGSNKFTSVFRLSVKVVNARNQQVLIEYF
jgi:hypothetical protein